jgi:UDP-N-acetylmuramoyl-tripeptide--D-alanyl-D-alanine ligase
VRYGLGDVPALLRTPVGRATIGEACFCLAWPLLSRLAGAYRAGAVRNTRVVAVVGSSGKTTTTRAVAAALGRGSGRAAGSNYSSYLAAGVLRIRPDAPHAVFEVGISRPGQMAGYARLLRPDVAVVTAIGSEHNRRLGGLERTRAEKARMVRALPRAGLAVLNRDDPHVRWMAGRTRARVSTFGFGAESDVRAGDVALDWPHGTRFTLRAAGQTRPVRARLIGRPMVYAILAAVAVGLEEGFELDALLPRLEALPPTPGRLEVDTLANGAALLRDDHKSTVETLDAALGVLAEVPARRRLVVLGEIDDPPGSPWPHYRRVGERVGRVATRAVIVGTAESFRHYAAGASRAGLGAQALVHAGPSVRAAIALLRGELGPGDVVLLKGRWGQRLERVALALAGNRVHCDITYCSLRLGRCGRCPMLERGWSGLRVIPERAKLGVAPREGALLQ